MQAQAGSRLGELPWLLGLAGLLPQLFFCILAFGSERWQWVAIACGFAYAAAIFSFLGGAWWGLALLRPGAPRWIYIAAVVPSLVALLLFMPWTLGWLWPRPSLIVLGLCLIASPLVDLKISRDLPLPTRWMRLRFMLSIGLGGCTLLLAV